ncbi:hypothetical protein BHM03_00039448 [Ensete ventricosum]|nr:hypothetical protein BHM03_00039448 [Ensete ventricosum]
MEQTLENPIPIRSSDIQLVKNLKKADDACEIHSNVLYGSSDPSLFSSSLPVLQHVKYAPGGVQSTVDASFKSKKPSKDVEGKVSVDDLDLQGTGLLLPDDEEALLSGIMNDFDLTGLPSQVDELEEYDLFGSLGGMELDSDSAESIRVGIAKASISDGFLGNGTNQHSLHNGVGPISGEHPYGEHPSRTLFVRNINSNVEDSELRSLFEVVLYYNFVTLFLPKPIHTLMLKCKHW